MKAKHDAAPTMPGGVIYFDPSQLHRLPRREKDGAVGISYALRMTMQRELMPAGVNRGHLIFLENHYDGCASATVTKSTRRYSIATCTT